MTNEEIAEAVGFAATLQRTGFNVQSPMKDLARCVLALNERLGRAERVCAFAEMLNCDWPVLVRELKEWRKGSGK